MKKFELVAMGGTFDFIHKGHIKLISEAFLVSDKVIIGLTSDKLASRKGKKLQNNYNQRFENLVKAIENNFPNSSFEISKLDNDFGPAVLEKEVQALVVSDETSNQGDVLNQLRDQKGMPPVEVVVVPMVLAKDGNRISTTRMRNKEIDDEGNLLSID
ncbi:MAG: pantetheine-phosphate adenylyltransferase [Nitrososphaeria archaeon]|nr:pantetheine-phosphate adenylyltransferase [Nitrosopumilaceae archaeon]NIP10532.1 pantetheine-phosphate adenylyltransferase [Nitrosopumilaceae archaeon]NIP90942.1 pantetheine-phosphate adenylyltransferase [Nitrososphaeria archaeon]NIS94558.1 pantetheine-phosphate adenylyltransferase [Nitrosopumilaceae archaeon]